MMSDEAGTAVLAAEKARCAALIAADREAMAALFEDGFTYIHSTGRVDTRQSYLDALGTRVRYHKAEHSDVEVRVIGDVAVLSGNLDLVQQPRDAAPRDVAFRFLGVWLRRDTGWVAVAHQNTRRA
jgi:ketosteroid isomerase-like protein